MRHERVLAALLVLVLAGCASSPDSRPAQRGSSVNASAAELQVKLGQGYMEQGDYEIALERLTRAIELDPGSADAHTVLAVLNEKIGRPERAETHYKRSVQIKPESGLMLNNFGAFLCRSGRFQESIEQFGKALQDPFYRTPEAALANAGSCSRKAGLLPQAESYYRQALDRQPRDAGVLLDMSDMMFQSGNLMGARAFMQRYQALGNSSAEALGLAVRIELALGDRSAAKDYLDTLRRSFPDSSLILELQPEDKT